MYSVVIPHLSNSICIESCLKYLNQNSLYQNELILIEDERDVYYAFNKGVYKSNYETVVLLNDDMIVSKNWDKYIPIYSKQDTILTGYVVEPGDNAADQCIRYDCGTSPQSFNYEKFQNFINGHQFPEIIFDAKGWYQPLVVNQRTFITYPNINKFPEYSNDVKLINEIMPYAGFQFAQINMPVYHFQRQATIKSNALKKRCIFTYCNYQINQKIQYLQSKIIEKFNSIINCEYKFLIYTQPDGELLPDQVIDYAFNKLFYEENIETILMLDIDCIPLSSNAINYVFQQAEQGKIVGNIQRSNHIENNQHVYVAPSAICISRETFEKLNKPSFKPTLQSDIGEELCIKAEQQNIELEMFMPVDFQTLPFNSSEPWNLKDDMPKYGIGTTFVNKNNEQMFYHLFECRRQIFDDLFFNKCKDILIGQ